MNCWDFVAGIAGTRSPILCTERCGTKRAISASWFRASREPGRPRRRNIFCSIWAWPVRRANGSKT